MRFWENFYKNLLINTQIFVKLAVFLNFLGQNYFTVSIDPKIWSICEISSKYHYKTTSEQNIIMENKIVDFVNFLGK